MLQEYWPEKVGSPCAVAGLCLSAVGELAASICGGKSANGTQVRNRVHADNWFDDSFCTGLSTWLSSVTNLVRGPGDKIQLHALWHLQISLRWAAGVLDMSQMAKNSYAVGSGYLSETLTSFIEQASTGASQFIGWR
jgi:hypothetical protein